MSRPTSKSRLVVLDGRARAAGTVWLVGAGPGDPELLTIKALKALGRADVVVHDGLVSGEILELAPGDARLINVAKRKSRHTLPQDDINQLLVAFALEGLNVVRLKGGDPFVFARGGEEAMALAEAGVAYEVVPGVSSAIAAPAYAGIPVTMRHSSTLFTVITGHEDPDKGGEIDWSTVAKLGGTIVVLMGVGRLAKIVSRLIEGGLPPDTPAAAVQWGTRPNQRTVRATLATLTDHDIRPPSTIVIGHVAAMQLDWFESRPLFGRRIVVTRAREQASELSTALVAQGAQAIEAPVIEVLPPADGGTALSEAAKRVGEYDWLILTSANAARRFLAELRDARDLGGVQLAAIGPGTADVLAAANLVADLVPPRFVAESLLEALPSPPPGGGRALLARAAVARDVLPAGLRDQGWELDVVEAYRTGAAPVTDEDREAVADADAVTFTSSSTVERFLEADLPVPPVVACIGPITAATAETHGLTVDIVADPHTIAALVDALTKRLS